MRTRGGKFSLLGAAILCFALASAETERKPVLTILFTAESHGALLPCDCPLQPLGGVARRATLIKKYRERGPVLLVDAGNWAAGGIYDEDSDGDPERDRLRTELMARAMIAMNYDFIGQGDEERRCFQSMHFDAKTTALLKNVEIEAKDWTRSGLQRNGIEIFTFARWDNNNSQPPKLDQTVPIPAPANSIFVSPFGEEYSEQFAVANQNNAALKLIINGGRKSSTRTSWQVAGKTIANFDFQSKRLGVAEFFEGNAPGSFDIRVRHEALTSEIADDPEIAKLLEPHLEALKKRTKKRLEIEFWTMPECPGCIQARPDIEQVARDLQGRGEVRLHFVVHKENGVFGSLHGERELKESYVQAVVQKYYPEKIWAWLSWRDTHRDASWEEGAREFGLLAARVRGALKSGEAEALLEADYQLMQRRHIDGTPTLIIANRTYDDQLERARVLRVICGLLDAPRPSACKDVPACFFDAQCRKRGFIGKCIDAGKAAARCDISRPALKIPATIILDRDNLFDNHERILDALAGDLPGIEISERDISEPDVRALADKMKVKRLPAYILDPLAKSEVDYGESVGKIAAEDQGTGKLVLKGFAVGAHRIIDRPRMKGRVDLFVSRFSKNGEEALETALEFLQTAKPQPELIVHDVLYWRESNIPGAQKELAATNGLPEIQEAAIAMAVRKLAPEKLNAYLLERGKKRGALYWDAPLRVVGMDPEKVRALAEKPSDEVLAALHAEADLLKSLESGGEIVLLAENCELIPIRSRKDLREMLEKIAQRK